MTLYGPEPQSLLRQAVGVSDNQGTFKTLEMHTPTPQTLNPTLQNTLHISLKPETLKSSNPYSQDLIHLRL